MTPLKSNFPLERHICYVFHDVITSTKCFTPDQTAHMIALSQQSWLNLQATFSKKKQKTKQAGLFLHKISWKTIRNCLLERIF